MKKTLISVLSVLLLLTNAAQAESSVACAYMLLRVYHAELDYCRVKLPKDREDRYQRLRAGMEKFIRENARNDPELMIAGIADNEKRAISLLKTCQSDDFKLARQAMDELLTPMNEQLVNENLSYKRNPQSGTCG